MLDRPHCLGDREKNVRVSIYSVIPNICFEIQSLDGNTNKRKIPRDWIYLKEESHYKVFLKNRFSPLHLVYNILLSLLISFAFSFVL